jgi:hypothetical protein
MTKYERARILGTRALQIRCVAAPARGSEGAEWTEWRGGGCGQMIYASAGRQQTLCPALIHESGPGDERLGFKRQGTRSRESTELEDCSPLFCC